MANTTLLKRNYRVMSESLKKLQEKDASTDNALLNYRRSIKEIPDVYNKDGKENPVKPISLTVANKNVVYAIKHYEKKAVDMDLDSFKKIINKNNGKNHWLLYNYDKDQLIDPTPEKVTNLVQNYQKGLYRDLQANYAKEKQNGISL